MQLVEFPEKDKRDMVWKKKLNLQIHDCKQRTHQAPSLINGKESTSRHITGNFHNTRDGENIQESSRKRDEGWGRNPGKASAIMAPDFTARREAGRQWDSIVIVLNRIGSEF